MQKHKNLKEYSKMKNKTKLHRSNVFGAVGGIAAFAQQQSFAGTITDSMCGASHMAKDKTAAECTRICVKDIMKHALAVETKVYILEGHEAQLSKLAG
jgi:hypothetical protein